MKNTIIPFSFKKEKTKRKKEKKITLIPSPYLQCT